MDDPKIQAKLSVQDRAEQSFRDESPIVFRFATIADSMPQYPSQARDIALDAFWRTEPLLAGAIYSMCAKVAALDYTLKGPRRAATRFKNVLMSADLGSGWISFVFKIVQDLLTQDNGAFMELLRPRGSNQNTPVQGVAQLDSQRCIRTGDVRFPVIYRSDKTGQEHELKWYQVVPLADMPSPREINKGIGYCAVSRVLRAAQIIRDIGTYKRQKLSGKRVPGLLVVQGIRRGAVVAQLQEAMMEQENMGKTLYTSPVVIASQDPALPVDAKLVELAGLPDGYDEDKTFKWYITTMALDFGTDYTEFAPLPGGNLGSATQSTEMAARSRGKGPGVVLQQFEYTMNWNVLPPNVEFQFSSTDPLAERERVELRTMRAKERAARVQSQELTPLQALQLAVQEGDAPEAFLTPQVPSAQEERIDLMVREVEALEQKALQVAESVLVPWPTGGSEVRRA